MQRFSLFCVFFFFFFNDTATTEIYTLSLHDALPISRDGHDLGAEELHPYHVGPLAAGVLLAHVDDAILAVERGDGGGRSEEHTSELQSRQYLVCRLLLEKKKKKRREQSTTLVNYRSR